MTQVRFTDESLMPLGSHKGKKLANVPAQHLLWLWEQKWFQEKDDTPLYAYIVENLEVLRQQKRSDEQHRK